MLLFIAIANQLSAHAVWIETAAHGKIGQAQDVKVYFGEYGQGERDKVEKWYSDLKDLTLYGQENMYLKPAISVRILAKQTEINIKPSGKVLLIVLRLKSNGGLSSKCPFFFTSFVVYSVKYKR